MRLEITSERVLSERLPRDRSGVTDERKIRSDSTLHGQLRADFFCVQEIEVPGRRVVPNGTL